MTERRSSLRARARVRVLAAGAIAGALLLPGLAAPSATATMPGTNGRIAFESDDTTSFDALTVEPDGSDIRGLKGCTGDAYGGAFSPDGKKIAFVCASSGDAEIYLASANGRSSAPLTNNLVDDVSPTWSPDGTRIAFVRGDGPDNIFVMPATGGAATNLTQDSSYYRDLDWSPITDEILFVDEGVSYTLRTIPAIPQPSAPTPVQVSTVTGVRSPSWSPDGTQIVFARFLGALSMEVYKIALDDPNAAVLMSDATDGLIDASPVWSPDGTKIAFAHDTADRPASQDVYVMDAADGANRVPILQASYGQSPTSWAPQVTPPCTIVGTSGSDLLVGTPGDDVICGLQGSDRIEGRGGNDILRGGRGDDLLVGGAGDDEIHGDKGIDTVSFIGDAAVDADLRLGTATGEGSDTLFALEYMIGSSANDVLRGDGHDNRIRGLGGDDILMGRAGYDWLLGGDGNDTLDGGPGHDNCLQGPGTGTLTSCR